MIVTRWTLFSLVLVGMVAGAVLFWLGYVVGARDVTGAVCTSKWAPVLPEVCQ